MTDFNRPKSSKDFLNAFEELYQRSPIPLHNVIVFYSDGDIFISSTFSFLWLNQSVICCTTVNQE